MNYKVYCYIDQINNLYKNISKFPSFFRGVVFEKINENIFHLFTEMPKSMQKGKYYPATFTLINNNTNITELTKKLKEEFYKQHSLYPKVYAFLILNNNENPKLKAIIEENNNFVEAKVGFIPGKEELYSRSKGLLEHSLMANKKVAIVGLGSFGSYIAVELAKTGIGTFLLYDNDILEIHNITRHQCGLQDIGRLKVNAIADLIYDKNPYANVKKFPIDILKEPETFINSVKNADIIIATTDNNPSRFLINDIALQHKITTIFGRAITRAEGGDIFILKAKEIENKPCFTCLLGNGIFQEAQEEISSLKQARKQSRDYTPEHEIIDKVQVGLSADIHPITNMIVKLTLLQLTKNENTTMKSLQEDLTAEYYFWANRRENVYKKLKPMKTFANNISILRWYGVKIEKNKNCLSCSLI